MLYIIISKRRVIMRHLKQILFIVLFSLHISSFAFASETLILYYTRTGNNKVIAEHLQSHIKDATLAEIKTTDDRGGIFGFITCAFDQWFDRDAEISELSITMDDYDTVIICAPIWMQNLSSPARTFITQSDLKSKPFYLFITYGGRLQEENKNGIEKWLIGQGVALKGVYGSAVGSKTEEEIKKQINDHLKSTELLGVKT